MATGSYVYRDSIYGQRLILDLSRSGNTVNWTLKLQSTGSMSANVSWSVGGNGSGSGTTRVSYGSGFTAKLGSGSFSRAAASTVSASATMFWGGKPSVSASIAAAGSKPEAITNLTHERLTATSIKFDFTKGTGSTQTRITMQTNGGKWTTYDTITGSTKTIAGLGSNNRRKFNFVSGNAVGEGPVVGSLYIYTQPKTPSGIQVTADGTVSWVNNAAYTSAWEVEKRYPSATKLIEVASTRSWKDTGAKTPLTQYRVRLRAGTEPTSSAWWSDWSEWSEPLMAATYQPPTVKTFEAHRCDVNGNLTELGTYLKVVASGSSVSVKDGTTETNKLWLRFRRREPGGSWSNLTLLNGGAVGAWTREFVAGGGGIDPTKTYEIAIEVHDTYTTNWIQSLREVSVSKVAFSLAKDGIGAGKTYEESVGGALQVGGDAHIEGNLHLADPNVIVIDGVSYKTSGAFTIQTGTGTASSPLWYWRYNPTMPYTPPPGWRFYFTAAGSAANFVWVGGQNNIDTANPTVILAMGGSSSRTAYVYWQLVKWS